MRCANNFFRICWDYMNVLNIWRLAIQMKEKVKIWIKNDKKYLNDKCNQWKEAEDIDYSVYGTY